MPADLDVGPRNNSDDSIYKGFAVFHLEGQQDSRAKTTQRKCRSVPLSYCIELAPPEQIGVLSVTIYQRQGEAGIRRILGILSLAKRYGTAALEDACAAAIEIGVPAYRFVHRYLERRPQLTLRQVDPLIRELPSITTSSILKPVKEYGVVGDIEVAEITPEKGVDWIWRKPACPEDSTSGAIEVESSRPNLSFFEVAKTQQDRADQLRTGLTSLAPAFP
jgi:hypothetical protein